MTTLDQRVAAVIDQANHRKHLQELIGAKEATSQFVRRINDPELARRVHALPTATQFEHERRLAALRAATTRDEAEENIGLPRPSLYTWVTRNADSRALWDALPARPKGPAGTPENALRRRLNIIAECVTLSEAAERLRIPQQELDHWLHRNGQHDEATRLRAAQQARRRAESTTSDINIHFGPIVRDPAIWRKAVSRMPADLRWYLGPEPQEEAA